MKTVEVLLDSVDKVVSFVDKIKAYDCDFDLGSSRVMIDAKSILGILSLGIGSPIDLTIHKSENMDEILTSINSYIVE